MLKRLLQIVSILLAASLALSACAGGTSAPAPNKPLRFGWSLYPGWYPLVIAEQQGFFKKHNVDVDLVLYNEYKQTAPQLAAELTDGAALVLSDVLLEDVGRYSSIVAATDTSHGADQLIATPEIAASGDLRGKRLGAAIGTFGELLIREALKRRGLAMTDVALVNIPPESAAEALSQNKIDVAHTFEPFASQAIRQGNVSIFTSADTPGLIVDTLVFSNAFLRERPEDVRNFLNAWFEAVEYWQKNPAEGAAIIAAATNQNPQEINFDGIKFLSREENLAAFQPGNDTRSIVFTAQLGMKFMAESASVTRLMDVEQILNPSFLK